MKIVIDIDDEQVLFDIKNRGLEAESKTDKVIINALYNGTPLPEHHGRLIDADAIEYTHAIARSLDDGHNWNELCVTKDELYNAPTIIEAEGSDSE